MDFRTRAGLAVLLLTAPGAANAQFQFTKLADTTTPTGIAGANFTSFIGATPGAGGGVAFSANLSASPATAYYLYNNGVLTRIVSKGDNAPGGGTINTLNGSLALDPTNQLSFYSSTTGGPGSGIYTAALGASGVTLKAIALKGQTTPDGGEFNPSGGFSVWTNNSGEIGFLSTQSSSVTGSAWSVYKYSAGVNILLAKGGQNAPGETPGDISNTFNTFAFPTLNNNGDVTFFATVISNLSGQVIFTTSGTNLSRLEQTGNPTPLGGTFSQLTQPYKNSSGLFSFRGQFNNGSSTRQGVWLQTSAGVITNLALQGANAPGGGVFGSAYDNVNLNDAGQGVFRATGMTGSTTAAIYLFTTSGIQKVLAVNDTLFGVSVASVGRPMLDELGRIAFDYTLTGGVAGVALALPVSHVSGILALEAISPTAPAQPVTFTFRTAGFADFVASAAVSQSGTFSVDLPKRSGVLHIKGAKYLAANVSVDATGGDVSGVTAFLPAGDANNDNSVDSSDFGILIGAFNTDSSVPNGGYDPTADFNGDGLVDSSDFGILIGEFNNTGAL